jgi:hypothetical protein
MPTRSKVLGNGTIRGEETLRVPGGLRRFLKKNILNQAVEIGRMRISHLGNSG